MLDALRDERPRMRPEDLDLRANWQRFLVVNPPPDAPASIAIATNRDGE